MNKLFEAHKDLSSSALKALIERSPHKAVRRIRDEATGEYWYWDASLATHAEGAAELGIPYDKRPGEGDILTL